MYTVLLSKNFNDNSAFVNYEVLVLITVSALTLGNYTDFAAMSIFLLLN